MSSRCGRLLSGIAAEHRVSIAALIAPAIAATVTTATTTAAGVTARGAFFLGTSDIDFERTTHEFLILKLANGFIGLLSGRHRHESKTARTTRKAVTHNGHFSDSAGFAEQFLEIIFHGIPREVAYKHLVFH